MAQSGLLESVKDRTGKFSVSVERVVNLGNYETLRVGLSEVLDLGAEKPEDAYHRILEKVDAWTSQLKPTKPAAAMQQPAKSPMPPATIRSEDPYFSLPWKQSQKKQNLGTILISPQTLENPLVRELYDRVREVKSMKVNQVSYRYSKMDNGTEFLQKWSPVKLG